VAPSGEQQVSVSWFDARPQLRVQSLDSGWDGLIKFWDEEYLRTCSVFRLLIITVKRSA
jgi:hypothetical protein